MNQGLLLLAMAALGTSHVVAQGNSASGSEGRPVADSTIVAMISGAAIRELGDEIATAAFASTDRPWQVELPDSAGEFWEPVRRHLFAVLRAREVTPADSAYMRLVIDHVSLAGDTLRARIAVGAQWRCGVRWLGAGTFYELEGVRHGGAWGYPPLKVVRVGNGDSIPCRQ